MDMHRTAKLIDHDYRHYSKYTLDETIGYFQKYFLPNEVFTPRELVDWVKDHFNVDKVYDTDALHEWAEENGYTKEED